MKQFDFENFEWINKPKKFVHDHNRLLIQTEPGTDIWQRTYYGFQNSNAPAFLTGIQGDFSFSVKTEFEEAINQYDQCGIFMYIDNENWVKVSVEYENEQFSRLGSVVTNLGYSDWATADIPSDISEMWFRLSRRGQDFYIESSPNGYNFNQMRIFHMHQILGKTMVGVYACSPLNSSYNAVFSDFNIGTCLWPEYNNHE